jgi:4-hydroxy-tetrahydrodipicolinate synthase
VDMLPETVERLAKINNIIGIKEATGDIERIKDIINRCGADFEVYSGDDATAMEAILAGAKGDISVTANVAPKEMHEMCMAALNQDRDTASKINDKLMCLHSNLFVEANPIPVKWALAEMGKMGTGIRLPLTVLAKDNQKVVRDALQEAGIV